MNAIQRLFDGNRSQEIEALANKLGLRYTKKDEFGLIKQLGDFRLFQKGSFRRINYLLRDSRNLDFKTAVFDYRYTISSGKHSRTYLQTVFFVESTSLALPRFLLKPENFLHRIGKYLNLTQDIEVDAYPEFSDNYLVQGEIPDLVKDMIPEELARFFMVDKKWSLEGLNYYLIFYQNNKRLSPTEIEHFYQKGLGIVEMLKGG